MTEGDLKLQVAELGEAVRKVNAIARKIHEGAEAEVSYRTTELSLLRQAGSCELLVPLVRTVKVYSDEYTSTQP